MSPNYGHLKRHGAVTRHVRFKFPSMSGFTYDSAKGYESPLGCLIQAKYAVTQRLAQTVGSPL